MSERRRNQHACTEMLAGEEDARWDLHPFDFLCNDGEATSCSPV